MNGGMVETSSERSVTSLSNDEVIIRLLYTINHLSRWLSPIHDDIKLTRSPHRDEPSVKDLVMRMRDHELEVYPRLYAMAAQDRPNLDALPPVVRTEADLAFDRQARTFEVMAEFRRLRQSTTSLLRTLPDDAWQRDGISRSRHDTTIRQTAEFLVLADQRHLGEVDRALARSGARSGIARASQAGLDELLKLAR
ncbi:MAG: hypothetical protein ACKOWF_07740 [Chloroflexota bacterium]